MLENIVTAPKIVPLVLGILHVRLSDIILLLFLYIIFYFIFLVIYILNLLLVSNYHCIWLNFLFRLSDQALERRLV